MMRFCGHSFLIASLALSIAILSSCVTLPTDRNSPPNTPILSIASGSSPLAVPCTLLVSCTDSDGDEVAYQFQIEDFFYSNSQETAGDWSSYFPSGETVGFLFSGEQGPYSIRVRSRDEMNELSPISRPPAMDYRSWT